LTSRHHLTDWLRQNRLQMHFPMDLVRSVVGLVQAEIQQLEPLGLEPLELLVDPRRQQLQNLERPTNQMTSRERQYFEVRRPLGFRFPN
jgi:dihydropteroate synthase